MLKNIFLISLSSLIALILAAALGELILKHRYNSWRAEFDLSGGSLGQGLPVASSNETLLWEYRPNATYVQPEFGTETRTNQFGFRQRDGVRLDKQEDVLRVAFIGDSVTLGREVDFEATFPEVYLRTQDDRRNKVEALNFGIDGYNTTQIAELLATRVVEFEPDVVVYSLCLNDFDFEEASGAKIRYFAPPDSFFLDAMKKVYRLAVVEDYYRYFFELNKENVFVEIARMQAAAKSIGADFQVAVVPVFDFEGGSFDFYEPREIHQGIVDRLKAERIQVVDLLPYFERTGFGPEDVAYDNWHLNEKGHALVGDALAGHIK